MTCEHSSGYTTCLVLLFISIILPVCCGAYLFDSVTKRLFLFFQFTDKIATYNSMSPRLLGFCHIRRLANILSRICVLRPQWVKSLLLCCISVPSTPCICGLLIAVVILQMSMISPGSTRLCGVGKSGPFELAQSRIIFQCSGLIWRFVNIITCRI